MTKKLFYLLLVLLPVNLGKHFIFPESYVGGILVDYLIPTVFLQDILIVFILLSWLVDKARILKRFSAIKFSNNLAKVFGVSVVCLLVFEFVSVFFSKIPLIAFVSFSKELLYFGLALYAYQNISFKKEYKKILGFMLIGLVFTALVGISQFIIQRSVFNNYLFFGEQPYSISTRNITKEDVLGTYKIPAYGFFRHPNALGGFIAVVIIWLVAEGITKPVLKAGLIICVAALLVTFSFTAWLGFVLGLLLLKYSWFRNKSLVLLPPILILGFYFFLIGNFTFSASSASLYRRVSLLTASYEIIENNFLFGVGYGSMTTEIEKNLVPPVKDLRFVQPVHNIFVLKFVESGAFSFTAFLIIFFVSAYVLSMRSITTIGIYEKLPLISLAQVAVIGSFDHYFLTLHQTGILLWLVFGFAFQIINSNLDKQESI